MNKIVTIVLMCFVYTSQAQTSTKLSDSLTLDKIIKEVISNHPSIKQVEEALNMAESKISYAKSFSLPDISASAGYTRIGPTQELTFPGFGTFKLYPDDNWNAAVNVHQTVWDFGRVAGNVDVEKSNKELSLLTLDQTKQKMAIVSVHTFYTIVYLQKAIEIKDEQLTTLKEHLDFVKKKKESGSATEYEILSIEVKISNIESQKMDLETALNVQLTVLNSLLGETSNKQHTVKSDLNTQLPAFINDSLVSTAFAKRDEMVILANKNATAELRLKLAGLQRYPSIDAFASGGWKNGYIPDLNKLTANYTIGLGVKIPILDGHRTKLTVDMAKSALISNTFEVETTKRTITNEVIENKTNMDAALKKVHQFEMQYSLAQKAHALAQTNFKAGAITNLDLLDATTSVSESRLYLLKSKIDYEISIFKLKAAMGMKLY